MTATNDTMKTQFQEIQIGQTFVQVGTEDCLMRKTKDAAHNKAGRAVVVKDARAPQLEGRELTVPQNRNCTLKSH